MALLDANLERETLPSRVIASEAKQSISPRNERMDCFVAEFIIGAHSRDPLAPRNDGQGLAVTNTD
jgi:hypothetical protein